MLGDKTVCASVAVKSMDTAKSFYEDKLGLKKTDNQDPGGTMYKSGDSCIFVYESSFAGTNKATAASWGVGEDLEAIVKELQDKGVTFETYDMPGATREGVIHTIGDTKAAWFKDPDGNILNLVNKM